MDEDNEVVAMLLNVGKKINKNQEQLKPFIKKIVEDNWLDSLESLKSLSEDEWNKLNLPIRLIDEIKKELSIKEKENNTKNNELNESNFANNYKCKKGPTNICEEEKKTNINLNKKMKKNKCDDNEKNIIDIKNYNMRNFNILTDNHSEVKNEMPILSNHEHIECNEQKNVETAKLENKELLKNSIIKFNKEKYEELINNNINDIQNEDIFYLSYDNDISETYYHSNDETLKSVNIINEIENLKKIEINDLKIIIPIFCKIIKNILINPNILKTRILKSTNDIMKNKILKYDESRNFLFFIGFVKIASYFVMEKVDTVLLLCIYDNLKNFAKGSIKMDAKPKTLFDPFKSSIVCLDTLKKSKLKTDNEMDQILKKKKEQVEKLMSQTTELNPKIYLYQKNVNENKINKNFDSSDTDKDESKEDVSHLISNIKNLYKEQTFQSKTKLELEKISNRKVYVKTVLKILFPDFYVLEMSFSSGTLIKEVNECIKKFLHDSISSREWYIYETPGIYKFDPQKKLSDYNLFPHALLRFKLVDKSNNLVNTRFLSDEAISKYFQLK
ncbi:conserved Plasmodium protein, unknown function [Plasmodium gallinaceum]|uniref:PUB domain-containing protein n=1 Tax=Plasmodium gallinaceum TaxID=5849 RepID=A0A1J1GY71_PLAGA|nr:conserved Plasmodium protein, unknown function [Plasmodium gallinaceum]CRG97432.1 conserved Plasmodium protein, unknown function [Plasmodium gallinaceum]